MVNKKLLRIASGILSVFMILATIYVALTYQVQIRTSGDYLSFSFGKYTAEAATLSQNPTANTNGTLPWTNPGNGYTSNNSYATVSPTYAATTSKNPTADTNGTAPWTNPANGYTSNNSYATAVSVIPTYRAAGAMAHSAAGPITVAVPAGMSANDVVFMYAVCYTGGTIAITTNGSITTWNAVASTPVDVASGDKLYVWWGVFSSGSTGATLTLTAGDHILGRMVAYSSVNTTSPIDVSATGTEATSDNTFSFATGLTTTYNNEVIICIASTTFDPSSDSTTAFSTMTNGSLTSLAERCDNDVNEGNGGGAAFDQGTLITNGAVGTFACTYSAGVSPKAYIAIALKSTNAGNVFDHIYGTFAITDPGTTSTITKVEVGYEAYATATQKLNLYESTDGGSGWSGAHLTANLGTSDPGTYTYIDVTSDFAWTWTLLNDSNFKLKVITSWVNGTPTWSIDALVIRVTYDDRRAYDQIYRVFGVTGSGPITAVEVGYEAYASATGKLDLYTSANGGSSWSSVHTTANLGTSDPGSYTYVDVTSDQTWTWTLLNDSNFQVKVITNYVSGTPAWSLDALIVRVTYTAADITLNPSSINFNSGNPLNWDTVYWSNGSTPGTWPLTDGECTWTLTSSTIAVDTTITGANFTGGAGTSLTSGAPGLDTIRVTWYLSGATNEGSGIYLTTSPVAFVTNLAGGNTKKYEFRLEMGTASDSTNRMGIFVITASPH